MKFNYRFLISVAACSLFALAFSYCSKSSKAPTVTTTYTGSISAQVGSNTFQSTELFNATDASGTMYLAGNQITGGDSAAMTLTFPDSLYANGTFTDTAGKLFVITYFDQAKGLNYRSGYGKPAGTLVITSFSKSAYAISGSFTGSVYPGGNGTLAPIQITDGSFSATYVPIP